MCGMRVELNVGVEREETKKRKALIEKQSASKKSESSEE